MTDIEIRDAVLSDAPDLVRLLTQLGHDRDSAFVISKLQNFSDLPYGFVIVAVHNGWTCGFLSFNAQVLFHKEGLLGTVDALCVDSSARNQGFGAALLHACESRARALGCTRIALVSGQKRLAAHRFYRREGYDERARRFVKDLI